MHTPRAFRAIVLGAALVAPATLAVLPAATAAQTIAPGTALISHATRRPSLCVRRVSGTRTSCAASQAVRSISCFSAVAAAVRLLIIDEVHLLNDERGPVIETLIARTQRQVPSPLCSWAGAIFFICLGMIWME